MLALFPLVFFAANATWMYSTNANVDAWKAAGYFVHPQLLYAQVPGAYQGSRVIHGALGWLAHHWLPVAAAIFVQKAATFYAGYLFLFGALRAWFRNERAALIGAALGLTNGVVIYNLSWDNVFGTCVVLVLGTLWAQARMREAQRLWAWQMLAGAFFVGAVCTYLAQAVVAPMVFGFFVYGLPRWRWRELAAGLGWAALGGVLVLGLQAAISAGSGGPWLFFAQQIAAAGSYSSGQWGVPMVVWWQGAVWLPFYLLVLLLALFGVWRGGRLAYAGSGERPTGVWASLAAPLPFVCMMYIAVFAEFCFFGASGLWPLLQNEAECSLMLVFPLLVTGGWVAWMLERMPERRQWVVVTAALAGILLVYGLPEKLPGYWGLALIPLVIAGAVAGVQAGPRRNLAGAVVLVAALAGFNLFLSNAEVANPRRLQAHVEENVDLFGAVAKIDQWAEEGRVWFWINRAGPNGKFASELADFYIYGSSLVGDKFPGLENEIEEAGKPSATRKLNLRAGMRIVLIEPQASELADAQAGLAKRGLQLVPLAQMETAVPGKPLRLELWEAEPIVPTRGVAVDISRVETPDGVTRVAAPKGKEFIYSAGVKQPVWKLELPEGLAPKAGEPLDQAQGKPAGVLRMRIGGNARRLRVMLTDEKGRLLGQTIVDPGTTVRDAWLDLKPGVNYRALLVRPAEAGEGGSFVVETVEE